MYRASFIVLYCDQQMHNYFTNYHTPTFFDVLLTVHLSIFISVINQLDAENSDIISPIHTYSYDDTRGCVMQF